MVKVKAKALSQAAGQKVSEKKTKDERKVLKVISKGNGSAQPTVSLKAKKKNRRRRSKINKNETQNETPSKINNEVKSGVEDSTVQPQDSNTASKEQQEDEQSGNAQSSDISFELKEEKEPTSMIAERPESKSKVIGAQEPTTETTESEDSQKSGKQGKNKRNRKKRKASEALRDTEDTTGTIENKGDGEDATEGKKTKKRQKVEDKNEGENKEEKDKSKPEKTKGQKEKKHVLFIGNLPFDATDDDIREHFKVVGDSIVRVTLMSRQKNAKGKGYGFLELTDAAAYSTALKLNLSQLKGRKINVEFTTPGKNTKERKSFIKLKTKKLLGQKKGNKGKKKKGSRKH